MIPNIIFNDHPRCMECSIKIIPGARLGNVSSIHSIWLHLKHCECLTNKFHADAADAESVEHSCVAMTRVTSAKSSLYTSKPSKYHLVTWTTILHPSRS